MEEYTREQLQEAKDLTIEVWTELRDNPEKDKDDLSKKLLDQIENMQCECPLCELFFNDDCRHCPLDKTGHSCLNLSSEESYYSQWEDAEDLSSRAYFAGLLLQVVKDWKIK